jgi:hypothetical protein
MGYEFIYMAVIGVFLIHTLIYRRNNFIGSFLYLLMSLLLINPMIDAGLGLGMPILLTFTSLIALIFSMMKD